MEIPIESVGQFIEKCLSHSAQKKEGIQLFFRGVNQIFPQPHKPSIYYNKCLIENEDKIFKETLSFFPELLEQKTTVEKLIMMQHYSFPTRIMDISKNPLVSLFFACFSDKALKSSKENGAVYMFSVPENEIKYCDSDAVSVIANLCKRPKDFSVRSIYNLNWKAFKDQEHILYLVHEIKEEKPHFLNLVAKEDLISVVCLRPRMNNPRIIRQDGYFFLFGIDYEKEKCAKIKPEWIDKTKFIIPSGAKEKILKELDRLNINEAFVFPDYEHISNYIKAKYSEKFKEYKNA